MCETETKTVFFAKVMMFAYLLFMCETETKTVFFAKVMMFA